MIAVFLIGAAIVLLLHGFLYRRSWFRNLSVQVHFSRPHICAREVLELTEIIENRKKLALPIVEIGFRVPRGLHFEDAENTLVSDYVYKRDIFAVSGMERIVRRYHVTAQKRGFYSVSQLTCHVPSRLFSRIYMMDRSEQEEEAGLYVYAANVDCSMLMRSVEVILGEREISRRLYEDPFVFSSIRPYTMQDPMKAINWKATAKTGELMVNTYASSAAVRTKIFLDVSADPGTPFSDSLRELAIATAASVIRRLVKEQRDAELVVNCSAGAMTAGMSAGARADAVQAAGSKAGSAKGTGIRTSAAQAARAGTGSARAVGAGFAKGAGVRTGAAQTALPSPCVRFVSCMGAEKLTAVEEFLTTDFDEAPLLSFTEILQSEVCFSAQSATRSSVRSDGNSSMRKEGTLSVQREPGQNASHGAGDVFYIFLTYADSPSLRRQIHDLLGPQAGGVLAVPSRTADQRRAEWDRNLYILPVYETGV